MDSGEDTPADLVRVSGTGECDHPDLTHLGGDSGGNEYYRCRECDAALIRKGSVSGPELRASIEAESPTTGPNPFAALVDPDGGPPSPGTASPRAPSRPSLAGTLRAAVVDRLPLFGDEDRGE